MSLKLLSLTQWSLSAALLIGAVVLLRSLLHRTRRLPQTLWPLLWWLVLARLLLPINLPCPYSLQNFLPQNALPAEAGYNMQGDNLSPAEDVELIHSDSTSPRYAEPIQPSSTVVTYQTATPPAIKQSAQPDWPKIWHLIRGTGTVLSAAFFSLIYRRSKRRFRQAEALPPELQNVVQQWLAAHPLRRPISVRQTDAISAPLTYGLLHPVILLPRNITDIADNEQLHFALLHEWTHIRHFDAAGKLLAVAALCLHWFNPAVWLFFALFNRDLELACDNSVVRSCGANSACRRNYALALLSWAEKQNAPAAFYSSFGQNWHNQNVIAERIVNIMNVRKVSFLGLTLACLLVLVTAAACATNPPANGQAQTPTDLLSADALDNMDYIDYENMSDEELHQLFSAQVQAQWAMVLEPYIQFGLGWQYDDADFDGMGLKMYYQGHEVRGIYDETTGAWLTEHTGNSNFAADAVELYAVYTDGQLSGLRLATPEEQAEWDEQRAQPLLKDMQPYERFGLTLGEQNRLFYNDQPVRYFWDGYTIIKDGQEIGRAIHFEYLNTNGEVDLRAKRDVIYNADGSTDNFGELLGVEVYVENNFAEMLNPIGRQIAYAEYDGEQSDETAIQPNVTYAITHSNPDEEAADDQTIAERLAQYEQFGLEYREVITAQGTRRDIYFQGELVNAFIDNTRSSGLTVQSSSQPEQPQFVMTEYDNRRQLIGLRLATEEEVNERLERYSQRPDSISFTQGYNADGEPTLYYSTDNNRTRKAIAKPE